MIDQAEHDIVEEQPPATEHGTRPPRAERQQPPERPIHEFPAAAH